MITGPRTELLAVVNSLSLFNCIRAQPKLRRSLFGVVAKDGQPHSSRVSEEQSPTQSEIDSHESSPNPTSLLIWDQPSIQELGRPALRGCTDILRILSCFPSTSPHSSENWITDLIMRSLFDFRALDAQVKVLSISFACTTVQASVCIGVKGSSALADSRALLSEYIDRNVESTWRRRDNFFYLTDPATAAKISPTHLKECIDSTMLLSVAPAVPKLKKHVKGNRHETKPKAFHIEGQESQAIPEGSFKLRDSASRCFKRRLSVIYVIPTICAGAVLRFARARSQAEKRL
ncbi:hypothetical protein SISNIDRAFT_469325 [Sistotremastrum niveocremeum HHB9708]|uniref:Uncharacterized protein n=1 Tax=Sistotremastrum niveocremeum HHB9708 TaxID=1314777 RepID=A0A164QDS6_9AGAM|nr:hypothetical protein SISNIDRAFT_469325 [Sistotremastrum niveocremeum HHB9708]